MSAVIINSKKIKYRKETGKVIFTYFELQRLPEWPDSELLEIINGDLFLVPSPSLNHQRIVGNLYTLFHTFLTENKVGTVFVSPVDVLLSEENVVIPDIFFVTMKNKTILKEKFVQGSPDLIIEVLSSNRKRDLEDKLILYEKFKVKEYWIVNGQNKNIQQYHLNNNALTKIKLFNENDIIKSILPELNALEIKVKNIFDF